MATHRTKEAKITESRVVCAVFASGLADRCLGARERAPYGALASVSSRRKCDRVQSGDAEPWTREIRPAPSRRETPVARRASGRQERRFPRDGLAKAHHAHLADFDPAIPQVMVRFWGGRNAAEILAREFAAEPALHFDLVEETFLQLLDGASLRADVIFEALGRENAIAFFDDDDTKGLGVGHSRLLSRMGQELRKRIEKWTKR